MKISSTTDLWPRAVPLVLFAALWLDLIRQLSYQWETNEQYAYGWFVPIFAIALLWRRWADRPLTSGSSLTSDLRPLTSGPGRLALAIFIVILAAALLPLRVIHEINQDWPLITWPYTIIVVLLTLYAFHLADPSRSPTPDLRPLTSVSLPTSDLRPLTSGSLPPSAPRPQPSIASAKEGLTSVSPSSAGHRSPLPAPRSELTSDLRPLISGSLPPSDLRPPTSVSPPPSAPQVSHFNSQLSTFNFSPWLLHFFFPIAFILVAVRWPWRIEHALTQNLMQVVASITVEIAGWLNVPALQRGNLIEISTGVLGVDEACSGIRSFQSTLMAGLLMGELYRLRLSIRAALVVIGLGIAFGFNLIRTLILTLQAEKEGISAIDKWHDPAGFTIAIATFFCLWAIAILVAKRWSTKAPEISPTSGPPAPPTSDLCPLTSDAAPSFPSVESAKPQLSTFNSQLSTLPPTTSVSPPSDAPRPELTSDLRPLTSGRWRRYATAIGLWSLFAIAATEAWYRSHQIHRADTIQWWVSYPTNLPSFKPVTVSKSAAKMLKHDQENGGSWEEPDGTKWSVYCFRWNEGDPTARMSAQGHRPEYCMVGSGHTMLSMSDIRHIPAHDLDLPFRLYTFESDGQPMHVFFALWEDGAENQTGFAKTKQGDRLRTVLEGRRGMGQQTLEIICTGYPDMDAAEKAVRARLPEIIKLERQGSRSLTADL